MAAMAAKRHSLSAFSALGWPSWRPEKPKAKNAPEPEPLLDGRHSGLKTPESLLDGRHSGLKTPESLLDGVVEPNRRRAAWATANKREKAHRVVRRLPLHVQSGV